VPSFLAQAMECMRQERRGVTFDGHAAKSFDRRPAYGDADQPMLERV
jgi:hypothetical protein